MSQNLSQLARVQTTGIMEELDVYPKVSASETVSQLVSRFEKTQSYEIIVARGNNSQALVTVRDVLKVVHPERSTVGSISSASHLNLFPRSRVYDAAATLVDNRIRLLPVIEGGKVLGVVSQREILRSMAGCVDLREFFAEDVMTRNPTAVERDATIGLARSLMLRGRISHLPVIGRNKTLFGLVTAKDLVWNFVKPAESTKVGERAGERLDWTRMTISGLADRHPLESTSTTRVSVITRDMIEKNRSCCVVVKESKPIGVITPRDVVALLKQFKPRLQIPLFIVGVEDVDDDEVAHARRKIERVAVRGLKMYPEIQEIIVHAKTSPPHLGGRRRTSARVRVYTNTEVLGVKSEGWSSFPSMVDDLCRKLDARLRAEKGYRNRRRPNRVRKVR